MIVAEVRFRFFAAAAHSDGPIDDTERNLLTRLAKRMGLSDEEASRCLEAAAGGAKVPLVPPGDSTERKKILDDLVEIFVADGTFSEQEQTFLRRSAAGLGLSSQQVGDLLGGTERRCRREPTEAEVPSNSFRWSAIWIWVLVGMAVAVALGWGIFRRSG